jgi:hypothetical protein
MNGLKTSRVIVVDDRFDEGTAILRALSKLGIGAKYFTGDVEELPSGPISGIRLLVLDLILGDSSPSPKQRLTQLMSVLGKLLPEHPDPLVIICWSNHSDLVEEFQKQLKELRPNLKAVNVISMDKSKMVIQDSDNQGGKAYDVTKIVEVIQSHVKDWQPLDLILEWEQHVHDAASQTTASLGNLISKDSWQDGMKQMIGSLARASKGRALESTAKDILSGFFESLNPLHFDHLEQISLNLKSDSSPPFNANSYLGNTKLDDLQRAKLNKMLLLSPVKEEAKAIPGNIYESKWSVDNKGKTTPFPINADEIDTKRFIHDMFDEKNHEECREPKLKLSRSRKTSKSYKEKSKKLDSLYKKLRERLRKSALPILVELTPSCDFAQNKNPICRLVAGVIVPVTWKDCIKDRALYLKAIGPVLLNDQAEPSFIVLNAQYTFGLPQKALQTPLPIARIRHQLLVDIQAWLSSHTSRPGVISL